MMYLTTTRTDASCTAVCEGALLVNDDAGVGGRVVLPQKLIAGPELFICNECIDLSEGLVTEQLAKGPKES